MDSSFTFVTSMTPAAGKVRGIPKFSKLSEGKANNDKTVPKKAKKCKKKKDSFIVSDTSSLDESITIYHQLHNERIKIDVMKTLTPRSRSKYKSDSHDDGIFTPFISRTKSISFDDTSSEKENNNNYNPRKLNAKKIKYSSSDDDSERCEIKEKSLSLTSILSSNASSSSAKLSSSGIETSYKSENEQSKENKSGKSTPDSIFGINQFSSSEDVYLFHPDEEAMKVKLKVFKKRSVSRKSIGKNSSENEPANQNEVQISKKSTIKKTKTVIETKKSRVRKPLKINNSVNLTKVPPTSINENEGVNSNVLTPTYNFKQLDRANNIAESIKKNLVTCTPLRFNLKNLNSNLSNKKIEDKSSFLRSLSILCSPHSLHPDAEPYRKKFKKLKEELVKKLFELYNEEVFDNMLPKDMKIEWNSRMRSSSGFCYNKRTKTVIGPNNECLRTSSIALSTKIIESPERLRDTLIHELCHAATWIINKKADGHGPVWKAWARRAHQAFPELPPIKRCHDYKISTKFKYKCVQCGYTVGRHSKSLNLERKRCGYCFGKFELFLNQEAFKGGVSTSPRIVKPKPLTKFALFVKENYGKVKCDNTDLKHGDIMKTLSKNFKEINIS